MSVEPTQMPEAELTKEQFMAACVADGTEQSVCEARWNAAHESNPQVPPQAQSPASTGPPTMADYMRENEMLHARVKLREDQLKQAIEIANRANAQTKAKDDAQKNMLISSIQMDSDFTKDELTKKNLSELQIIRLTLDKNMNKTFASIAADMDAANKKRQPHLTAGAWDPQKKQWVGGM